MTIPQSLVDALRAGQVVPFVGTGVSMAVRRADGTALFPSWAGLLERGADRLDRESKGAEAGAVRDLLTDRSPDYLQAAEKLREGLGGALWGRFLKEEIDLSSSAADDATLDLARAVWGLGSLLLLTTNYDRVLRWACPDPREIVEWGVEHLAELAQLTRDDSVAKPTVWHLHGKIDNVANLVLTPGDYKRLYPDGTNGQPRWVGALATLRQQLAAKTFLFIGFSLDDAHFGVELKSVFEVFGGFSGSHYALVHERDEDRLRGQGLPVELLTFEDFGEPLLELVRELGRCTRPGTTSAPVVSVPGAEGPNPFGDRGRITEPDRFFDREDILEHIFGELGAGRSISLVGEAQVGKSSVLTQVCVRGPKRLGRAPEDFVYLDMQSLCGDEDFFEALGEELGLPGLKGWKLSRALRGRRVVLCLDEFEKMTYSGFTGEVRSQLRGLADGNEAPLTLILASRTTLGELFPDDPTETSPIAPIAQELQLGPFSGDVARNFLRQRLATTGRHFSEDDEERILTVSGGHPGRLQALAYACYAQR